MLDLYVIVILVESRGGSIVRACANWIDVPTNTGRPVVGNAVENHKHWLGTLAGTFFHYKFAHSLKGSGNQYHFYQNLKKAETPGKMTE